MFKLNSLGKAVASEMFVLVKSFAPRPMGVFPKTAKGKSCVDVGSACETHTVVKSFALHDLAASQNGIAIIGNSFALTVA